MALNRCTKTFCIFVCFLCLQDICNAFFMDVSREGASVEKRNDESDLLEEVDLILKIRVLTNLLRLEKEDMEGRAGGEKTNPADRITHNEDHPAEQMKTRSVNICALCARLIADSAGRSRRNLVAYCNKFKAQCGNYK